MSGNDALRTALTMERRLLKREQRRLKRDLEEVEREITANIATYVAHFPASGMSASGQDPQGLEAKPASAVAKPDAQKDAA
jgi:hypothetical protein